MNRITSSTNDNIKYLRALYRDKSLRNSDGVYVAEGATLVGDLPKERIKQVYVREDEQVLCAEFESYCPTFVVKNSVFDSLADTKSPSGVIAVVLKKQQISVSGDTILLLCGLTDGGNIGSIIRTAAARGIETVVCVDTSDPFSPKAVRAAMSGTEKTGILWCKTYIEALQLIKNYAIVSLDMGGNSIYSYKNKSKIAIAIGSEAHGVPQDIIDMSESILSVPMKKDSVESLNAAVSAAVAMYVIMGNME